MSLITLNVIMTSNTAMTSKSTNFNYWSFVAKSHPFERSQYPHIKKPGLQVGQKYMNGRQSHFFLLKE